MTRNEFELLYAIKKNGIQQFRKLKDLAGVSLGYISKTMKQFDERGWVDESGITTEGLRVLRPYKVDNVIIISEDCPCIQLPTRTDKAKGLRRIDNDILVERLIEQIQAAGIKDVVLVLGYQKEAFFYLEDKYDHIKIIINSEYTMRGNAKALSLVKSYAKNSYICMADNYFAVNPFEEYVYHSFWAGADMPKEEEGWSATIETGGRIVRISKGEASNPVLTELAYWDNKLSAKVLEILSGKKADVKYAISSLRQVFSENIKSLPPVYLKMVSEKTEKAAGQDQASDTMDYDLLYKLDPDVLDNISDTLKCAKGEIKNVRAIKEGLTNISFSFSVNGKRYVYRHPGEGTSAIISRSHEKKALELAKSIGIDSTYIYMDGEKGWKISSYVEGIRVPSYDSFEDSKRVLNVLRTLHRKNLYVEWSFLPWEETCKIEQLIKERRGRIADGSYETLKEAVKQCYDRCNNDGVEMCFCHCDTYAPNWMLTEQETILIDWEYAGYADPGCDIGTYIMDSMWDVEDAVRFIREYCREDFNESRLFHYLAYTAILSFYWYTWALYREACGAIMGESLYNWHMMAERYAKYLQTDIFL